MIKVFYLLVFTLGLYYSAPSHSKSTPDLLGDIKQVTSSQSCFSGAFETYDSWIDFLNKKKKNFNHEKFKQKYSKEEFNNNKATLFCYFFKYNVDGHEVDGFLVLPRKVEKLPVIIFNRGGSGTYGNITFTALYSNVLYMAKEGFAVIGSQYRGGTERSKKNNGKDEWGGQDVKDVEALFDIIYKLQSVDSNRIGMYGISRGSVNMFMAAKNTRKVRALVSAAGVYDLEYDLKFRPSMKRIYSKFIPEFENNKTVELEKRSVIKWANKLDLNAPILILHSSYDKRTSASGALNFALRLQELGHRYSINLFEASDHFFVDHKEKVRRTTIEWFNKYL